jgi:hypothetical protein
MIESWGEARIGGSDKISCYRCHKHLALLFCYLRIRGLGLASAMLAALLPSRCYTYPCHLNIMQTLTCGKDVLDVFPDPRNLRDSCAMQRFGMNAVAEYVLRNLHSR